MSCQPLKLGFVILKDCVSMSSEGAKITNQSKTE
jgi:hypothetical protein